MKKTGYVSGGVGLVLVGLFAGLVPSASASSLESSAVAQFEQETDAEGVVPFEPPVEQVEWQLAFGELTGQFQEQFPEDYANRRINEDRLSGSIVFSGDVPAGAAKLLSSVPGVTGEGGAGYTYAQRTASELVLLEQVEQSFGDQNFVMNLDHATNTLHLRLDESVPGITEAETAFIEDFGASARGVDLPTLETEIGPPLTDQAIDAGERTYSATGAAQCTTAFPVKKVGGSELGILTAGHCPAVNIRYRTTNSPYYFSVQSGSQITDNAAKGGDFRWLWSNTMLTGRTYLGDYGYRTFSSTGFIYGGDWDCPEFS